MRKLALGLLVLVALVAPLALADSALAAKPVKLKLLRIVCNEEQAGEIGGDEIYLKVNGSQVFGPADIAEGETLDLTSIAKRSFRNEIVVELFEDDGGLNQDDFLGAATIRRNLVGQGEQFVTFTGFESDYDLFFKVTRR